MTLWGPMSPATSVPILGARHRQGQVRPSCPSKGQVRENLPKGRPTAPGFEPMLVCTARLPGAVGAGQSSSHSSVPQCPEPIPGERCLGVSRRLRGPALSAAEAVHSVHGGLQTPGFASHEF